MAALVSGSAPRVRLSASSGSEFFDHGTFFDASRLIPGEWVPFELDLATSTDPATHTDPLFDPSQIRLLGVSFTSVDPSGGPVVIQVDTVTGG